MAKSGFSFGGGTAQQVQLPPPTVTNCGFSNDVSSRAEKADHIPEEAPVVKVHATAQLKWESMVLTHQDIGGPGIDDPTATAADAELSSAPGSAQAQQLPLPTDPTVLLTEIMGQKSPPPQAPPRRAPATSTFQRSLQRSLSCEHTAQSPRPQRRLRQSSQRTARSTQRSFSAGL